MKIDFFLQTNINSLGQNVVLPDATRNYCIFDTKKVDELVKKGGEAIPYIKAFLEKTDDEKQILEALYVLDRMIDAKVDGIEKLYPTISRFNETKSPNIQVLLAGIYRKTLVPDAFGPLNRMLIQQILTPNSPHFDPTEEIGGAILEYLRNKNASNIYLEISSKAKTLDTKVITAA